MRACTIYMIYGQYGTNSKRSAMKDNLTPPLQPGGLDAFSSNPEGNAEVEFFVFLPLLHFFVTTFTSAPGPMSGLLQNSGTA